MNVSVEYKDQKLKIIDQTKLPIEEEILVLDTLEAAVDAIKRLKVRGAPAIGVAAAYAVVISLIEKKYDFETTISMLRNSRPTAVNLFWALDRMVNVYNNFQSHSNIISVMEKAAKDIHDEDRLSCDQIGQNGLELLSHKKNIMTICNTGFLATGGIGTALGIIQRLWEKNKDIHVFVTETRPLLQGSRLTAWELKTLGIPFTLITDNMAAHVMATKKVDCIIAGADRIAINGDSANKIGTYALAVLANYHRIPFYIAAPISTIDFNISNGKEIPIEERNHDEVIGFGKNTIAPSQINCYNPSFDVTPNELIDAIITDKKVIRKKDFNRILELREEN